VFEIDSSVSLGIGFSRCVEDILAHVDCVSGDPEVSGSHVWLAVGATVVDKN